MARCTCSTWGNQKHVNKTACDRDSNTKGGDEQRFEQTDRQFSCWFPVYTSVDRQYRIIFFGRRRPGFFGRPPGPKVPGKVPGKIGRPNIPEGPPGIFGRPLAPKVPGKVPGKIGRPKIPEGRRPKNKMQTVSHNMFWKTPAWNFWSTSGVHEGPSAPPKGEASSDNTRVALYYFPRHR